MSTSPDGDASIDSPDPHLPPPFSKLNNKQLRALLLEVEGRMTDEEIAEEVGVHRSTLYRWRKQPAYRKAKEFLEREQLRHTLNHIAATDQLAIKTAAQAMREGNLEVTTWWLENRNLLEERPPGAADASDSPTAADRPGAGREFEFHPSTADEIVSLGRDGRKRVRELFDKFSDKREEPLPEETDPEDSS